MDLADLDRLCGWMRLNGATSVRVGELSLTLGPLPVSHAEQPADIPPSSEEDRVRHELETLLASSGADVEPFLRRRSA